MHFKKARNIADAQRKGNNVRTDQIQKTFYKWLNSHFRSVRKITRADWLLNDIGLADQMRFLVGIC